MPPMALLSQEMSCGVRENSCHRAAVWQQFGGSIPAVFRAPFRHPLRALSCLLGCLNEDPLQNESGMRKVYEPTYKEEVYKVVIQSDIDTEVDVGEAWYSDKKIQRVRVAGQDG